MRTQRLRNWKRSTRSDESGDLTNLSVRLRSKTTEGFVRLSALFEKGFSPFIEAARAEVWHPEEV